MKKLISPALIFAFLISFSFGFKTKKVMETITLSEAVKRGLVSCEYTNNPVSTHYQKPVVLHIKNLKNLGVSIKVENGTQVIPEDTSFQNILFTQQLILVLAPEQKIDTAIYGFCTEHSDAAPSRPKVMRYYPAGKATDAKLSALAKMIEENKYSGSYEAQNAIWILHDRGNVADVYGYDTIAVKKLKQAICNLTGQKMPPPPSPTDYTRNAYAEEYHKKITVGGEFEFSFYQTRKVQIAMFDKHNVVVRELYVNNAVPVGDHTFDYEFDASVYPDKLYYIRLVADGQIRLESKLTL